MVQSILKDKSLTFEVWENSMEPKCVGKSIGNNNLCSDRQKTNTNTFLSSHLPRYLSKSLAITTFPLIFLLPTRTCRHTSKYFVLGQ